jgi:toxin-antitoxin system PIN domain toxin
MTSSLFPDVNVWLALTHNRHVHHPDAARWFSSITGGTVFFCRFTQIGLLRLLTNSHVMEDEVMGQRQAWRAYRRWYDDRRVEFLREPESSEFEHWFEKLSESPRPSTKLWTDAYLAAFAKSAGLTVVTFDRGFPKIKPLNVQILAAE